MDLYEALKNGTSLEELRSQFQKELNAATEKLDQEKKEQEAKKKAAEALDKARLKAATAYYNYIKIYYGDRFNETNNSIDKINDTLKKSERWLDWTKDFDVKIYHDVDDDSIITEFIKAFR